MSQTSGKDSGDEGGPDGGEDLVTTEGVDEGSADSTAEGAQAPASGQGASGAARERRPVSQTDDDGGQATRVGPGPARPPAPPLELETEQSEQAREDHGTGQQLSVGEG